MSMPKNENVNLDPNYRSLPVHWRWRSRSFFDAVREKMASDDQRNDRERTQRIRAKADASEVNP